MKKLFFLFLLFSFTSLFSQESKVRYLRAQTLTMGVRNNQESPVKEWILDNMEVNILIELHQTKVVIFSKETQNYHIINQVSFDGTTAKWFCKDKNAIPCYIRMDFNEEYPQYMTVAVEYDDMVWFYICAQE